MVRKHSKGVGTGMGSSNKGITLVEIIIVLAILSVLAVSTFSGLSYIRYGNAKSCAYQINAALDKIRLDNMSKADKAYLYLYQFNGSYYMRESTGPASAALLNGEGVLLGNRQLGLFYQTSAGSGEQEVGDFGSGTFLGLSFEKSTGELSIHEVAGVPPAPSYCNRILIKDRDGTIRYTIHLIQASGKHYVE